MKESSKYNKFVNVLGPSYSRQNKVDKPRNINRMGSFSDYKHNVISNELLVIQGEYNVAILQGVGGFAGLISKKRWMTLSAGLRPKLKLSNAKREMVKCVVKLDNSACFRFVNDRTVILKSGKVKLRLRFGSDFEAQIWIDLIDRVLRHAQWMADFKPLQNISSSCNGRIVKCVHYKSRAEYAMKIIDKSSESSIEVEVLSRLFSAVGGESNIATYSRIFESGSKVCIVMPYYSYGTLLEKLEEEGCLSERVAAIIIRSIIVGLKSIHKAGVIHCDLKLENLIFESEDLSSIRIIDFGSAFILSTSAMTTKLLGTPGYIAPERLQGLNPTTVSDVFSAGVVLYQMLSGNHPFTASNSQLCLSDTQRYDLKLQSGVWQDVSDCAKDLVRRMLAFDANGRIDCKGILAHPWIVLHNLQADTET